MIRILADSKIALVEEVFSELGEVELYRAPAITTHGLQRADVLLVRSETRVDSQLLANSSVKFVGTATIGVDHIDSDYLDLRGIAFASAPGSNAHSVAEYVLAALLELGVKRGTPLRGQSLGVVGVGNIGSLVARMGSVIGMQILLNDPPRARLEKDIPFLPLEDVLQADVVTIHVPLIREGDDATWHLLDRCRLHSMSPHTTLLNTSRGPVIDNASLLERVKEGRRRVVLDVWEGEPAINCELLSLIELGTPHIAGYSWDGKVRGTTMIYRACCDYFRRDASWQPGSNEVQGGPSIKFPPAASALDFERNLLHLVRLSYQIERDDRLLRVLPTLQKNARASYFRQLRLNYPVRREFSSVQVQVEGEDEANVLAELGFAVKRPG